MVLPVFDSGYALGVYTRSEPSQGRFPVQYVFMEATINCTKDNPLMVSMGIKAREIDHPGFQSCATLVNCAVGGRARVGYSTGGQ